MTMRTRASYRARAFTLLEVMLVAGILVLLAALVVPSLVGTADKARINIAKSQIGRSGPIASALSRYRFDVGTYPSTDDGLAALFTIPSSVDEDSGKWQGPYIEGDPEELRDPWRNEYQYRSPGEFHEDSYDLWSMGPDGRDGTDDDITNWKKR